MTTEIKNHISAEEMARRVAVRKANDEAAKAFIPQAEKELASLFNLPELTDVHRKAMKEMIEKKARALFVASTKKGSSAGVRAPKEVLKRMFQKAFGYAKKANVSDDDSMALIVEASKDPIMPVEPKKKDEGASVA